MLKLVRKLLGRAPSVSLTIANMTPDRTELVISRRGDLVKVTSVHRQLASGAGRGEGEVLALGEHSSKDVASCGGDDKAG